MSQAGTLRLISSSRCRPVVQLHRLGLVPLIRRIAAKADAAALEEFHTNRTLFRIAHGPPMSLVAFLDHLQETWWARGLCGGDPVAVDRAYGMTLAKFLERPRAGAKRRRKGPDCRHYYRGFLAVLGHWRNDHRSAGALEEEATVPVLLQRYVLRHFRKSCEEVGRTSNPAICRYTWRLPRGTIVVYMPVSVARRRRRKWLEDNIDDPDPKRPGERERVQSIIDARLGVPRHVPIDGNEVSSSVTSPIGRSPFDVVITVDGLASAVADEKADNLDRQRPAIQRLGRAGLKRFIHRAFQDLHDGCYQEKRLAEQFKLSRPTVTRFAGSRWRTRPESRPPDLWANVAHVLAANDDFVEAAISTGAWPRAQTIIQQAAQPRNGRTHHA